MPTLAFKLALTPALIAAASLAGRRWGPAISGWLVGLPFTSGPIAFFLALAHGAPFAAADATGTLAGALSQVAFCLAYAWLAVRLGIHRSAWLPAFAAGTLAFTAATVLLARFPLSLAPLIPVVFVVLLLALRLMPHGRGRGRGTEGAGAQWAAGESAPKSVPARGGPADESATQYEDRPDADASEVACGGPADESAPKGLRSQSLPAQAGSGVIRLGRQGESQSQTRMDIAMPVAPPRWDLPLRMAVATAFVVLLTALAPLLGAHLTGLLAPFPLFASVLAVFAHTQRGPADAAGVLHGLLLGLFSFAGFFITLALLLIPAGIVLAFAAAIAAALSIQAGSLWLLHPASA